jgi:hypothetical protein
MANELNTITTNPDTVNIAVVLATKAFGIPISGVRNMHHEALPVRTRQNVRVCVAATS